MLVKKSKPDSHVMPFTILFFIGFAAGCVTTDLMVHPDDQPEGNLSCLSDIYSEQCHAWCK